MIGIYKITNLITGQIYIGQSVDIKRRIAEHKTPRASGNNKLHEDIQFYGLDNFMFDIIEECKKEELNAKELQYIKLFKPYYNTVGKKVPKKTRDKISRGTKKWWSSLDEETKKKIIEKNLTGPRKGHEVSLETRDKIRKWIEKNQGQKVMIVETGQVFRRIKDLENYLGACTGTCAAYWSGKIKTVKGFHVVKCRD
ncbi:GIY-YIG nuclease family protein [Holdemania massiliensis]|uniref:GIY-YIG nuclease family protein n=1 Tax=Holdemania massiliensis TaxID=1468449 RepID=UPI003565618E